MLTHDLVAYVGKDTKLERAPAPEGWALEPAEDDATLTIPEGVSDQETSLGRLCELLPKVWLLCFVHCSALTSSALAIASVSANSGSRLLSLAGLVPLCFCTWVTLYLAAGVLENVVRRRLWLRLLENGLLLQPAPTGYVELTLHSPEHAAIGACLVVMAAIAAGASIRTDTLAS